MNALEERIMNESGPDDERLQVDIQPEPLHRRHSGSQALGCRRRHADYREKGVVWGVLLGRQAVVSRGRHEPLRFEPPNSCDGCFDVRWQEIYERLEELDPATFETTAAKLLHGLGCAPAHAARMPWSVLCLYAKRRKPQVLGCSLELQPLSKA